MSGDISKKIRRKEILFYFDAANDKCYDGESETGYSLVLGTTASILTGVTWSAANGGNMVFSGTYSLGLFEYSIDSWISCGPRISQLAPTFPITLEAWINPKALNGETTVLTHNIFALDAPEQYPGNYYGVDMAITPNDGTDTHMLASGYYDGSSFGFGARRSMVSSGRPVQCGTWNHVVSVIAGIDDIRLYVNGATVSGTLSGGNSGGISWSSGIGKTTIGKGTGYYKYIFNGGISMVRAYNLELSWEEIKSNYDLHARRFEKI